MAGTNRQDALLSDIALLEVHGSEAAFTLTALSHSQRCAPEQLAAASDVVAKLFAVVGLLPALRRVLEEAPLLFTSQQLGSLHRHIVTAYSVCISVDDSTRLVDSSGPGGLEDFLSHTAAESTLGHLGRCFRDMVVVLNTIRATQLEEIDGVSETNHGASESRRLREALKHPEYSASASLTYESPPQPQGAASFYTAHKAPDPEPTPPGVATREVIELQHPPGFRGRYGHPDYPLSHKRGEVYLSPPDPGLHFDKSFEEAEVERQQLRDQGRYPNIAAFGNWPPCFIAANSIQDYQLRSIMLGENNDVAPQPYSPASTPIDTPASTRDSTPNAEGSDMNDFENIQPGEADLDPESACKTPTPEAGFKTEDTQAPSIASQSKNTPASQVVPETEENWHNRGEAELASEAGSQNEVKVENARVNDNNPDLTPKAAAPESVAPDLKQELASKAALPESACVEEQPSTTSSARQPKLELAEKPSKSMSSAPQLESKHHAGQSTAAATAEQPRSPQFGVPSPPSLFGGRYIPPTFQSFRKSLENLEAYTLQAVSQDTFAGVQWTYEIEFLSLSQDSINAHWRKLGPDYSVIDAAAKLLPEELRLIKRRVKAREAFLISAEYWKPSTMSTKMGAFEVNSVFFIIQTSKPFENGVKKDFLGNPVPPKPFESVGKTDFLGNPVPSKPFENALKKDFLGNPVPYRENHDNGLFGGKSASGFGFGKTTSMAWLNRAEHFHWEEDGIGRYTYQTITSIPPYKNLSLEELRLKEEAAGKPLTDAQPSLKPLTSTAAANLALGIPGGTGSAGASATPKSPSLNVLAKENGTTVSSTSQVQPTPDSGSALKPLTGLFGQSQSTLGSGPAGKSSNGLFDGPSLKRPSNEERLSRAPKPATPRPSGAFGSSTASITSATGRPKLSSESQSGSSTLATAGSSVLNKPPPPSTGLFGDSFHSQNQHGSGGSLFGSAATATAAPSTGGLFGSTPNNHVASSGFFGVGPPRPFPPLPGSLFGSGGTPRPTATSGSPFGNLGSAKQSATRSGGSLFGDTLNKTASSGGLFGTPSTPSSTTPLGGLGGLFSPAPRPTSVPSLFTSSHPFAGPHPSAPQQSSSGEPFHPFRSLFGSSRVTPASPPGGLFGNTPTAAPTSTSSGFFSPTSASKSLETNCRECKINLLFHSDKCRRGGVCLKCCPSMFGQEKCTICHRTDSKPNYLAASGQSANAHSSHTAVFGPASTSAPAAGSDSSEGGVALNSAQAQGSTEDKGKGKGKVPILVANKGAPGFEKASSEEEHDL